MGSGACTQCHAGLASKRQANSMSRALEPVESCGILKTHPRLSFRNGDYGYQIARAGDRSIYTITNGSESISEPILFVLARARQARLMCFNIRVSFTRAA